MKNEEKLQAYKDFYVASIIKGIGDPDLNAKAALKDYENFKESLQEKAVMILNVSDLSPRLYNILKFTGCIEKGVLNTEMLKTFTRLQVSKFRNLGKGSLAEMDKLYATLGIEYAEGIRYNNQ